ncbi:uncharacterized protein LOC110687055 [Chenopodium quinoa]|uniref:uncharacterized protein LOC110687055 n=1 Tax=Chenopodium quinoa TaxID=63459 RepID=UPI000B771F93|nr:uncharacterized protein LOC110687055 [Chenopodium quinoa]
MPTLPLDVITVAEQFIHTIVTTKDLHYQVACTFVYGLHSIQHRSAMWAGIKALGNIQLPWICIGDYNYILSSDDRFNGNPVTDYEVKDFKDFVHDLELVEIKSKGSFYSWNIKGHGMNGSASRIDRGLINEAWVLAYGQTEVVYLPPSLSNHCPVLVDVAHSVAGKGKPFRFLNCLASHQDFLEIVSSHWDVSISGNAMLFEEARFSLAEVQSHLAEDITNVSLQTQEAKRIEEVKYWINTYESILKQKSRVDWIKLGDSNSHYFFSVLNQRKNRNRIDSIYINDDIILKDPAMVQAEIIGFYKKLLGSAASTLPAVDIVVVRVGKQLSSEDIAILSAPISHSDIDHALASIGDDKAPGIDGFNTVFFKKTWNHVKTDVYKAVLDFFLTLVITARLAKFVGSVVNDAQAGFIPGKHIGGNLMLATELVKGNSHKYVTPRCLQDMTKDPYFNFHPRCEKLGITLLMFADDLLLFARADLDSVKLLFMAFQKFSMASGLFANLDKKDAYFGGILDQERCELQQVLGMANGTLPFRFQLYKSVLFGIQAFWAQIFVLPKKIIREMEPDSDVSFGLGKNLWTAPIPKKASWILKKILASRDIVNNMGGWSNVTVKWLVTKDRLLALGFTRSILSFTDELQWIIKYCRKNDVRSKLIVMCFSETVYNIWL